MTIRVCVRPMVYQAGDTNGLLFVDTAPVGGKFSSQESCKAQPVTVLSRA